MANAPAKAFRSCVLVALRGGYASRLATFTASLRVACAASLPVGCAASLLVACAASPAMRAAERGDHAALHDAIATRGSAGTLSNGDAASLAREVAGRELRSTPPAEAPDRVRDALACAHEFDDALADRMRVHDAAGADAALARIAGRGLGLGDARVFADDADPRWRAVGARALVRPKDREARLRALVDDDPRVRRQAARAARDAADAADLTALGEAARLDPEPIVRTEAVRALAALPPTPGGQAADLLRDLWTGGDDGLREDIALAWAAPAIWDAGGREALRLLVAAGRGPGAIEAAAAVLRHSNASGESVQAAIGQLVRSIEAGSRATRLQALAQAPLDRADVLDAVRKAATDEDLEVRVGALARLAATGRAQAAQASDAITALEALGQPGSAVAQRARFALASAGDRRVQAWIEADLTAAHPEDRLGAATSLATLGVPARAAPLLADTDATVRMRAACIIVMGVRSER
jgi:HEAT repeat protein